MGTTSVRRNLFQNHLSRRPVSTSAPTSGTSGLSSQVLQSSAPEPNSSINTSHVDDDEIVVRDKNGSYKLEIPVLPPIVGDGGEMEGIEGGPGGNSRGADSTDQCEMSGQERDKIEADLVEMIYRNRNRQKSSEPHEILNLVYQSLKNKVATLDEDSWMYEPEA